MNNWPRLDKLVHKLLHKKPVGQGGLALRVPAQEGQDQVRFESLREVFGYEF